MSVVTTVCIFASLDERAVARACEFTGNSQDAPLAMRKLDPCEVGGYKCAEVDMYVGSFNHFDTEGFKAHLATVEWEHPSEVVVVVHTGVPTEGIELVWRPQGKTP